MENEDSVEFRFSEFLSQVEVDQGVLLAHGPLMQRVVLDSDLAAPLRELRNKCFTPGVFAAACPGDLHGSSLFSALKERGLLVPADADEREAVREQTRTGATGKRSAASPAWPTTRYGAVPRLKSDGLGTDSVPPAPVSVLLLGGCVVQFAEAPLVERGLIRGKDVRTVHEWPGNAAHMARSIERVDPDVTVYQAGVQPFLTALWDQAHTADGAERAHLLALMKSALSANIAALAQALDGRLGLVHNFGPPALTPFGRFDFAEEYGMRRLTAELNAHVDHCVRRHAHLAVVDEERLVRLHGAPALFDDVHFPFGHHGGSVDPEREDPHQLPSLGEAFADEYLALHDIHHGIGAVKCVVVDLDNTLWPGIAADDGFGWIETDVTSRWIHLGLHQALSVLKSRGILLATCSKGDEGATLGAWRTASHRQLLEPDDFVLHRINWQPKSANLQDICDRLGFPPDQVMFLDDHPAERAEVSHTLPTMRVLDAPVHAFRRLLLTDPALETRVRTRTAQARTATTKAMLARDEWAKGKDRQDFLHTLGITLTVAPVRSDELERVAELFNRTNQFTTTTWRTTPRDIQRRLDRADTRLYTASVRDRFADYGLVGACLIEGSDVTAFALSCRVIGLDVAVPFLVAALSDPAYDRLLAGTRGRIVTTDRNTPAQDLYTDAGFEPDDTLGGCFVLTDPSCLPAPDPRAVTVTVRTDRSTSAEQDIA